MNEQLPTPPSRLSNTECLAILTSSYLVAKLTDEQKRALFRAVHALARRVAYKERWARKNADKGEYHTPDEVLANPPFAPTPAPLSPDAPPCVPAPETNAGTEEAAHE